MSDPTEPLRRALDTANARVAELEAQLAITHHNQKFIVEQVDKVAADNAKVWEVLMPLIAGQPVIPTDIRNIIRRWRDNFQQRAESKLDSPADFVGRMWLDEVAQIDAWLKEQEERKP